MLGALTMNTILTFGAILVVLVVGMIASYPDIAVVPMMAACVGVAVVVPIVAYPFTHTLWAAVDLAMRPLDAADIADAAAAVERAGAGPARDEDA